MSTIRTIQPRRHGGHGERPNLGRTLLCVLCASVVQSPAFASELLEKHTFTDTSGGSLPYRLARPEKAAGGDARLPLVVVLHGAGERGDDNEKQLRHMVPVFLSPENRTRHPCFLVAPQCPLDAKWTGINWQQVPHAPQTPEPTEPLRMVLALIEKLAAELPVDRDRIHLVGLSMGGSGAWDSITRHPERFGGAVILCGGADAAVGHRAARVPVWCFQGALDEIVVPGLSRNMIDAMRRAGGSPRYTEFPDAGHNIAGRVFGDPAVLDWLFAQRRASP